MANQPMIPVTRLQHQREEKIGVKQNFTYNVDFLALAPGNVATGTFNVESDSSFQWSKSCYWAQIGGLVQTASTRIIPLVSILINDISSGRNLMTNKIPVPSLFGTGQIPFVLPYPRVFVPKSTVQITVTNISAGTTYDLYLAFVGQKLFPREG